MFHAKGGVRFSNILIVIQDVNGASTRAGVQLSHFRCWRCPKRSKELLYQTRRLNGLHTPETVPSLVLMIPASAHIALLSQNVYHSQIDMF